MVLFVDVSSARSGSSVDVHLTRRSGGITVKLRTRNALLPVMRTEKNSLCSEPEALPALKTCVQWRTSLGSHKPGRPRTVLCTSSTSAQEPHVWDIRSSDEVQGLVRKLAVWASVVEEGNDRHRNAVSQDKSRGTTLSNAVIAMIERLVMCS